MQKVIHQPHLLCGIALFLSLVLLWPVPSHAMRDSNPVVADVGTQFERLNDYGEWAGFFMGAGAPQTAASSGRRVVPGQSRLRSHPRRRDGCLSQ